MTRRAIIAALALNACSAPDAVPFHAAPEPPRNLAPPAPTLLPFLSSQRDAIDANDEPTRVSLESLRTQTPSLLVLRIHAGAWCGTCQWSATHTGDFLRATADADAHARVVDVLVADRDNAPATLDSLRAFRTTMDNRTILSVVDPEFQAQSLLPPEGTGAPFVVLMNAASFKVVRTASNPDPTSLRRILQEAASILLPASSFPRLEPERLVDNVFHSNEWDMLRDMAAPTAPPPDPSNAYADNEAAAAFGKLLFGDATLSPSGTVSCTSCHDEAKGWSDGLALAKGMNVGTRRTPSIRTAAWARALFWDGRSSSLWGQALMPMENPLEMNSSRGYVAQQVASRYRESYVPIFGDLPPKGELPSAGRPGQATYDALPQATRDAVTRIYVNVGKAIAAYERTLREPETAFDRYIHGDSAALSSDAKEGLAMFLRNGCTQCHHGPRLTDDAFHNVGFGGSDEGRWQALGAREEFGPRSPYSDTTATPVTPSAPKTASCANLLRGAFKTPSLRGVATRAPFGHDGSLAAISAVTEHYADRGANKNATTPGYLPNPWLQEFSSTAAWSIPLFLEQLH